MQALYHVLVSLFSKFCNAKQGLHMNKFAFLHLNTSLNSYPCFWGSTGEPPSFKPCQSWWQYLGLAQRQMAANAWLEGTQGVEAAGGMTRTMFVLAAVKVSFAGAWSFWLILNTNVAAPGPPV